LSNTDLVLLEKCARYRAQFPEIVAVEMRWNFAKPTQSEVIKVILKQEFPGSGSFRKRPDQRLRSIYFSLYEMPDAAIEDRTEEISQTNFKPDFCRQSNVSHYWRLTNREPALTNIQLFAKAIGEPIPEWITTIFDTGQLVPGCTERLGQI